MAALRWPQKEMKTEDIGEAAGDRDRLRSGRRRPIVNVVRNAWWGQQSEAPAVRGKPGKERPIFFGAFFASRQGALMREVYRRVCGMDVHRDTIVVCVLPAVGKADSVIRKTYGTFRNELIRMRVWLKQLDVTEIAMESTGLYWRPVWNVLEEQGFQLLLVNPAQVKALAGRKSDGRDGQRIAEYLQDGRLDASFVPAPEVRQMRALLRHRVALIEQRNPVHNQIRDLFETANVKLSSVVSDLLGVSGRRIIEAMIAGQESAEILSWRVRGKLRKKAKVVKESLKGYFQDFHRTMLAALYRQYQFLTRR